ncbi:11765_t:CDS:2, partial [Scutellospora calospora]
INRQFNTTFTGNQCNDRFQRLLMMKYRNNKGGKSIFYRRLYFDEFRTFFWLQPDDSNDHEHRLNMSHR